MKVLTNSQNQVIVANNTAFEMPEPTGTIDITTNGTYDVKNYATADVEVESGITPLDKTVTFVSDNQDYQIISVKNGGKIKSIEKPTKQGLYFDKWQVNGADITFPYTPTNSEETATAVFSTSRLPSAYQEVEYLQSNGSQWILLPALPSDSYELKAVSTATDAERAVAGGTNLEIFVSTGGNWTLWSPSTNTGVSAYDILTLKHDSTGTYANGTKITFSNNNIPNCLFAYDTNKYPFKGRVYYYKSYAYSLMIEDIHLIPCYRKSDSVAGMYDLVTERFYTNRGSGSFIVGPDVN